MELIMYQLTEVKTKKQEEEFLRLPASLYEREEENRWISPLYQDTKTFFNKNKNPLLFKEGEANRWLLYDVNKHLIGRIAAFYWKHSKKVSKDSMGYFGFFECTDDKKGAEYLFKAATQWLSEKGFKGMQGPFHLGGPGFFTGSLVRGFFEPVYGVPYNFSFYNDLFLDYGFEDASKMETYQIMLADSGNWKFVGKKATDFYHDTRYSIETYDPKKCQKFAKDFTAIFNKFWDNVPGMASMTLERAMNRCKFLRPVLEKKTIFFLYFEEEPIAFLVAVPDVHQVIKKFKGRYNLLERMILWVAVHIFRKITILSGLIYGIVPEHQDKNLEAVLLSSLAEQIKYNKLEYSTLRLSRVGDFAPAMKKIVQQLDGKVYHQYVTYQLMFDKVGKKKAEPKPAT